MITYEYNCRNVEAYIDLEGNSDVVYNEIVVGWTQTAMGPGRMATFESNIAEQIELLINPITINLYIPLPETPDPEKP